MKNTIIYDAKRIKPLANSDLIDGLKNYDIWWNLAKMSIKERFRRTAIGPLWITLSLVIWVSMLTMFNSTVFHKNFLDTIPLLTVGMIFWTFLSTNLNEGCLAFISAEGIIKSLPIQISIHLYYLIAQNFLICLLNMILYPIAFIFTIYSSKTINLAYLTFIPGIILFIINCCWMTMILAILSARFRDVPKIMNSLTQVIFFATPIFWLPNKMSLPIFVILNPFYHIMEIVRSPLLGQYPSLLSWCITIFLGLIGWTCTISLYRKYFPRIKLWL